MGRREDLFKEGRYFPSLPILGTVHLLRAMGDQWSGQDSGYSPDEVDAIIAPWVDELQKALGVQALFKPVPRGVKIPVPIVDQYKFLCRVMREVEGWQTQHTDEIFGNILTLMNAFAGLLSPEKQKQLGLEKQVVVTEEGVEAAKKMVDLTWAEFSRKPPGINVRG